MSVLCRIYVGYMSFLCRLLPQDFIAIPLIISLLHFSLCHMSDDFEIFKDKDLKNRF